MHLIKKYLFSIICLLFLITVFARTSAASDVDRWRAFTADQKKLAIAGFADCYRSASPERRAFVKSDINRTVQLVDGVIGRKTDTFGTLILEAIKKAPFVKPDSHAEHWDGPTGFHTGLWWRGIEDSEREAYVQGVLWCAQLDNSITVAPSEQSVQQTIKTLNEWYLISDDDWKNPLSNERVDVPVFVALERTKALQIRGTGQHKR